MIKSVISSSPRDDGLTDSAFSTTELSKKYIPVIAYLLLGDLGFSSMETI